MKYSWTDIEPYLADSLSKTKHIMTFGTIGSRNVENDIDIIITKKPEAKLSGFYREIHKLFTDLNQYMNDNYGCNALKFVKLCHQDEALYLSGYKPGDLALHVMTYVSYPQLSKDWNWALGPTDDVKSLLGSYNSILGEKDMIYSEKFSKSQTNEHLILNLSQLDAINLKYPEELFLKKTNHSYRYVMKYANIDFNPITTREEAVNRFYELCDLLEK
ncbi:MAG: hypothetical protein ACP5OA_03530 [Candidatus Woesearchaeota archaeon]